VRKVDIGEFIG